MKYRVLLLGILLWEETIAGNCNSCLIKNGTPDVVNNYISTLNQVLGNITQHQESEERETRNNTSYNTRYRGITSLYTAMQERLYQAFSIVASWKYYFSYFEYYILYGIQNEYVSEIRRDHTLLEERNDTIAEYIENSLSVTPKYLKKEEVCQGVSVSCSFEGTIHEVLGQIKTNHQAFLEYFRLSIMGKKHTFQGTIELVPDTFFEEFNRYYNEYTTQNCSSCKEGFKNKIVNAINRIASLQESAREGIEEWKEAIALLNGSIDEQEYARIERELLAKELARQGLSSRASQAILNNLERYQESGGFTENNNFITNSFRYFITGIQSEIQEFQDSLRQYFSSSSSSQSQRNSTRNNTSRQSVPIHTLSKNTADLYTIKTIEESIHALYKQELPYAQMQDESSENLLHRLIHMHYNLMKGIEMLDRAIPISQKVCNDQARGIGKCIYK